MNLYSFFIIIFTNCIYFSTFKLSSIFLIIFCKSWIYVIIIIISEEFNKKFICTFKFFNSKDYININETKQNEIYIKFKIKNMIVSYINILEY